MTLTELLTEIERLDTAASPKPWRAYDIHGPNYGEIYGPIGDDQIDRVKVGRDYDAKFIALSRDALPLLVKYVRKYRKALEFYASQDKWEDNYSDWDGIYPSSIISDHGNIAHDSLEWNPEENGE